MHMPGIKEWIVSDLNKYIKGISVPFFRSIMPFESEAQRRFLYAHNPTLAKEFASKTPKNKKLPSKVAKNKKSTAPKKIKARVVSRKKHG